MKNIFTLQKIPILLYKKYWFCFTKNTDFVLQKILFVQTNMLKNVVLIDRVGDVHVCLSV
jgi:hypothetical protein